MLTCVRCLHGLGLPSAHDTDLTCEGCKTNYVKGTSGVWDFRLGHLPGDELQIFKEAEYLRWRKLFGANELKNWKIYDSPLKRFFSQAGHRIIGQILSAIVRPSDWVVEVGAGAGELLNCASLPNYIGIDTNWDALCLLAHQHQNTLLICTSGGRLPIADDTAQFVVALHTLEHIYRLGEFFEDVNRILTCDGTLHYAIPCEGGLPFALGRALVTGPHLRKTYNLDVDYVMDREHINDARRVLKFLRMYFNDTTSHYWPLRFARLLNCNVMIWGRGKKKVVG